MKSDKFFNDQLNIIKDDNLYIQFKEIDSPIDAKIKIAGKDYLNFCSNNYLGLANNPEIKNAAKKAIDKYGVGPAAVRTISGNLSLHEKLEKDIAKFKKTQAAITFQSGFVANLATIPAIVGEGDLIFSDELNHASIIDGCRLSKAKVIKFNHSDTKDLENKIKNTSKKSRKLIISDGVFSMDGDIANLPDLVKIAKKHNALVMVDDAHGEGVLGKNGRGIVDHYKLHGQVDIEVGTMSKAFGVIGGYVAANNSVVSWLRQRARPFLFSSAMTIPDVAACIKAVEILSRSDKLVQKLWNNTNLFKSNLSKLGFDTGNSSTPIIPIMLGDEKLAQTFSKKLFERGVFAKSITYPTVALGKARIRVMNSAAHSKTDIKKATFVFEEVGKILKVIK